ncbi:MAG: ABC transporter substrate-binding protein [Gammaproteobacteria bacterium]|nr:ABC transporter substrate-binding protein [Gammaproteobacteria bacterium]
MAIKRFAMGSGAFAAALLAATSVLAQQPLKIGALMPMTGDLQAYGETSLNGIRLAADEIQAAGGSISYVVGDTQTNPQSGVDAAQKLVNLEKVSGLVGALSSGVSIPVAQSVSSVSGVPQVSSASTSPVITGLADKDFLFRTVPSDAFQGVALASLTRDKGVARVSVIYVNNDYGKGLADAFSSAFAEKGGSVEATVAYEQKQAAYRGELQQASDGDPEALVLIGYPENGQTILRQALEGGYFSRFIFTDGLKAPELIDAIGAQYLNGTFGTAPQARADTPAAQHFKSAYEKRFGELPPKPFIDSAYDATYLLALAAEKAGSNDPMAIRDALRSVAAPPGTKVGPGEFGKARDLLAKGEEINYEGASGSQDFDANGDVPGTFAHWEIRDGEIVTITVFEPK